MQAQTPAYYLPAGISFVRGVVSVEASYLTDPNWQGLAARQGVLLAVAGHNPQSSLAALASATGHPEVAVAPFVPYGLSAGARRSLQTAVASPARTIAVLAHHPGRMFAIGNDGFNFNRLDGSVAADTLFDFAPAFPVPVLIFAGEQDNLSGFVMPLGNFEWGRSQGNAPWSYICQPQTSHTGNPLPSALTTAILEGILTRRLPSTNWPVNQQPTLNPIDVTTGYLGDPTTRAVETYSGFTGDRTRAAWFPDEASASQWASFVRPLPWVLPAQPIILPSVATNFQALDAASALVHPSNAAGGTSGEAAWKVCGNLKEGDLCYVNAHGGAILGVPSNLRGAEWIRPHPSAGAFTGSALARFDVTADSEVFIAHDSRITTKPAWLNGWTNTGESIQATTGTSLFASPLTLTLFRKTFAAGQTVELGPNGTTSGTVMYLVVVKPVTTGTGETTVSVITSDSSAAEDGPDSATFSLSRTGSTAGNLTVEYSLSGSAIPGVDFGALSGTAIIPDGEASTVILVTPFDDLEDEGAETVVLTLSPGEGYAVGASPAATITIADDDGASLPAVTISASPLEVTEGDGVSFDLTLSRTGSTAASLNVSLSVTGDAGYGSDYEGIALNVPIPAGQSSLTIPIAIFNDALVENPETAIFTVVPTTAYMEGTPSSTSVQISDDDSPADSLVTISVSPASGSEDGSTPAVFTVTRSGATLSSLPVSLSWTGTALSADTSGLPASVVIPDGQSSVAFSVSPVEDATTEGSESIIATILASSGVQPGSPASATFNITDNDNSQRGLIARQTFAAPPSGALLLDIYLPRGVSGPVPTVVTLFGGGWQNGTRSLLGIASALNTNGMACVAIDYRLTGTARWPAQLHDVKAAVRWLRANAPGLGLDPDRIGLYGQGSGGHLALCTALSGGQANVVVNSVHTDLEGSSVGNRGVSDHVQAVCSWYAPTDLLRLDNAPSAVNHNLATAQTGYLMGTVPPPPIAGTAIQSIPERTASGNPALYADDEDPPVLLMHGTSDTTTPFLQAEILHDSLIRSGVRATLLPVVGSGASFSTDENNTVVAFFRRELGVSTTNQIPVPIIQAAQLSGPAPLTVAFDGSSSNDGDGTLIRHAWSFGDNTGDSGSQVVREFATPGRYRVTLCVEDDARALASTSVVVEVIPSEAGAVPSVAITAPSPGFLHVAPGALHVQAEATPVAGSTIAAVEFYMNGTYVGRDTVAPYGISLGGLPGGNLELTARALDASGTQASSEVVVVQGLKPDLEPVLIAHEGRDYFGVRFHRYSAVTNRSDLVEFSTNLVDWDDTPILHDESAAGPGIVLRTFRSIVPMPVPAVFLRCTTQQPE